MKIISVVGARPNFMKIAPFIHRINKYNSSNEDKVEHILVHTGQHYDDRMSKVFFDSLNIPDADINLNVGSGSHAEQVGYTMIEFEKVLIEHKPDWVVVLGDVNATMACSITAKKLNIKVCHIEAGLRSGDIQMPEEINRLVTDSISDLLLTPDKLSTENLFKEGHSTNKVKFVGNIMIDTLMSNYDKTFNIDVNSIINDNIIQKKSQNTRIDNEDHFIVLTLHRPSNVDIKEILDKLVDFVINDVSSKMKVIWSVHPRTEKKLKDFGLWDTLITNNNIFMLHPIGYHEMLRLNDLCKMILTDSGGLQEECTVLGTPCITMRYNTERPVTLKEKGGVSVLVGNNIEDVKKEFENAFDKVKVKVIPELWDGNTAERCLEELLNY